MNKIEVVTQFFNNENLHGTKIFYGSCIEDHLDSKDVDCCIITDQTVDKNFYKRYKNFLVNNNFVLDEEIKYEDKLILNESKIHNAIKNYLNQQETVDLDNRYYEAVDRLIVNIFTTKSKVYDDEGNYEELSNKAWKNVLQKFNSLGGHNFSDFIRLFKINDQYKKYWGYAPRVIPDLFNRFNQHTSSDKFIKLLKEDVIKHPQKIAVYSPERNLTYQELDIMSDNIANSLLNFNSDYVIVNYPHSFELIPIAYGILKSGKIYIPVDNNSHPSEIKLIKNKFTDYIYISNINSDIAVEKVLNESHKIIDYARNDIAYIIHTSGTTGTPKGVCVSRKNLNYILNACQSFAPVSNKDCYLFSTRNTFDVSITEIFSFLYSGGSVFVYSVKNSDFYKHLPQIIKKFGITHVALSPSILGVLLRYSDKKAISQIDRLKYLLVAGEEFKKELLELVRSKLFNVNVFNVYGPTETTVYATSFNVKNTPSRSKRVPIGKALPGVITLIKNNELLIGGEGVSKGYFNDPKRTKESFESIDGQVFYHTGDIVEQNKDVIIYHGRKDNQIQLYGIRVELEDIRASISKIINDPSRELELVYDNNILTLFYTGKKIIDFRKILEENMISYKVPSRYENVSSFPLTSSGKVDKKKLLENLQSSSKTQFLIQSNSQIHEIVKKIAEEILNQKVGTTDDLLNLGLDSLNSVELSLALEKKFNLNLDSLNFYKNSSVNSIVSFIERLLNNSSSPTALTQKAPEFKIQNIPTYHKVLYTFPAFFYAKIYHSLKFDSQLYGRIFLDKGSISYEEIYHKLSKIEVFRSVLSDDLSSFQVLDTPVNISKYKVTNARVDIKDALQNAVSLNIAQHGLLYKFVLLEDDEESILYYSIDHSICDSASLDSLERYILGIYDESVDYSNYIEKIYSHNTTEKILKELPKFEGQNDNKVSKVLTELENKVNLINLTYLDSKTENVYAEILLYLRSQFLKTHNLNNVKVNLIYNIRKFSKDLDFSSTIGDLHIGLTYLLQRNTDVAKELDKLIAKYQKQMFNPKALGYRNFPNLNKYEQDIVDCFDNTVYISVDYLGVISKEEFDRIWSNALKTNKEINKLNGNKLNITAYIVDNELKLIISKKFNS